MPSYTNYSSIAPTTTITMSPKLIQATITPANTIKIAIIAATKATSIPITTITVAAAIEATSNGLVKL